LARQAGDSAGSINPRPGAEFNYIFSTISNPLIYGFVALQIRKFARRK
jgi:hypothetical protein